MKYSFLGYYEFGNAMLLSKTDDGAYVTSSALDYRMHHMVYL